MTAPLVVFAVGNPSRGDDALGPLLGERLMAWLAAEGLGDTVEVIDDFQLQIEHSLDLVGRSLALFVDAGTGTSPPYTFRRAAPSASASHSTHALSPEAVLQVFKQTAGGMPPDAYVLCVRGADFALGEPISTAAAAHAEAAFELLTRLCRQATPAAWDACQR